MAVNATDKIYATDGTTGLPKQASASDLAGALGIQQVLQFRGTITVAGGFPTPAEVQPGWTFRVLATVTDNDVTKTNTGQSFIAGDDIAWNGTDWSEVGPETLDETQVTTPSTSGLTNISGATLDAALASIDPQLGVTGAPVGVYYVGSESGDQVTIDAAVTQGESDVSAGGTIFIVLRDGINDWTGAGDPSGTHNVVVQGERGHAPGRDNTPATCHLNGVVFADNAAARRYISFVDVGIDGATTLGQNWTVMANGCRLSAQNGSTGTVFTLDVTNVLTFGSFYAPLDQPVLALQDTHMHNVDGEFKVIVSGGVVDQKGFFLANNCTLRPPADGKMVEATDIHVVYEKTRIAVDQSPPTAQSLHDLTLTGVTAEAEFRACVITWPGGPTGTAWLFDESGGAATVNLAFEDTEIVHLGAANAMGISNVGTTNYTGAVKIDATRSNSGYPADTVVPTGSLIRTGSWAFPPHIVETFDGTAWIPAHSVYEHTNPFAATAGKGAIGHTPDYNEVVINVGDDGASDRGSEWRGMTRLRQHLAHSEGASLNLAAAPGTGTQLAIGGTGQLEPMRQKSAYVVAVELSFYIVSVTGTGLTVQPTVDIGLSAGGTEIASGVALPTLPGTPLAGTGGLCVLEASLQTLYLLPGNSGGKDIYISVNTAASGGSISVVSARFFATFHLIPEPTLPV